MLKKGDIVLVAGILVLVALWYAVTAFYKSTDGGGHRIAVIKQDNNIIKSIDLNTVTQSQHIKVMDSYSEVILVEKGRIRFETANCPDKVCVKTGWLSKKGETAVCLPNRTVIKIEGKDSKVDGVAY